VYVSGAGVTTPPAADDPVLVDGGVLDGPPPSAWGAGVAFGALPEDELASNGTAAAMTAPTAVMQAALTPVEIGRRFPTTRV
jgi:hypothetical protein